MSKKNKKGSNLKKGCYCSQHIAELNYSDMHGLHNVFQVRAEKR